MSSSQDRQESILQCAFDIFSEVGFSAARMDDIAARAGVAKGLIYFYYKNKEKLFEAVLQEFLIKPVTSLGMENNPAESMAKRLVRLLDLIYTKTNATQFYSRVVRLVLIDGMRVPGIHDFYFNEIIARVMALMDTSLDEGARRGEWTPEAIPEHSQILIAPAIVLLLWQMVMSKYKEISVKDYALDHKKYVLRSLGLSEAAISEALRVSNEQQVQNLEVAPVATVPATRKKHARAARAKAAGLRRKSKD